jgi:hypothetical protein
MTPANNHDMSQSNGTGLSVAQLNAVDALVAGKNDREAAEQIGVSRVTVTRWKLYDVQFRAALAARRAEVWSGAADRLRALLPKALDVLAEALSDKAHGERRTNTALTLLKLAGLPVTPPDEPRHADEIVRLEVERERTLMESHSAAAVARMSGLPTVAEHTTEVRAKLLALAAGTDAGAPSTR